MDFINLSKYKLINMRRVLCNKYNAVTINNKGIITII